MYIQVRNNKGEETFIKENTLEAGIASGEIVSFRRSNGWVTVPVESCRGNNNGDSADYRGQERRRATLSRRKMFSETE